MAEYDFFRNRTEYPLLYLVQSNHILFSRPIVFPIQRLSAPKIQQDRFLFFWRKHARKKLVALGIPYFIFSTATWFLKTVFSGYVNSEVNSLAYNLFVHPLSPYWYLFALFFIFLLIPTFTDKRLYGIWVIAAVAGKLFVKTEWYALSIVVSNVCWFLIGVGIALFFLEDIWKQWHQAYGYILIVCFLLGSTLVWYYDVRYTVLDFLLGFVMCLGILIIAVRMENRPVSMTRYTMPIYLMHTIFAAGVRSVLFKLGITAAVIHVPVGLMASFLGPILAAEIMKRTKLDFFMEPGKYIRIT